MKEPDFMKAPFPYFGGKSRVADIVWRALGNPKHYMEPFFGSGAVLFRRPDYDQTVHLETVCDKDGFVANAWRGMQFAPDEVAKYCDWPVNHVDLNARRKYLQDHQEILSKLAQDPEYFDAKIAGYWIWGQGASIGSIKASQNGIPCLTAYPRGINMLSLIPSTTVELIVKDQYTPAIYQWFRVLSERLRRVRVVCGDWNKICGGNWQDFKGAGCGIFFDPPYSDKANRKLNLYAEDSLDVAHEVREWCKIKGKIPTYRIVLAGYYEEHEELLNEGWTVHKWKAKGGYANATEAGREKNNREKEALFFSPHCLKPDQQTLF